jgi:hypothetical protein
MALKVLLLATITCAPLAWAAGLEGQVVEVVSGFMGDARQGISAESWLCEDHHPDAARPFLNLVLDWGLVGVEKTRDLYPSYIAVVWIQDRANIEEVPRWHYEIHLQGVPQASDKGADFCVEAAFTRAHPPG